MAFASGTPQRLLSMICKTFSRSPIPAKLMGNAEMVRSTGITAKKLTHWHRRAQCVSRTEKSRERGHVRYERRTKRDERRAPMMRVKMIGGGNFDQFVAARELLRQ